MQAKYRRAQALERLGRVEDALESFRALVKDVPAAKEDAQRAHNLVNLSALPLVPVLWRCVAGQMRGWATAKDGSKFRPWVACIVRTDPPREGESGVAGLLNMKRLAQPPTTDDLTFLCLDAMARAKSKPATVAFQECDFLPRQLTILGASPASASTGALRLPCV